MKILTKEGQELKTLDLGIVEAGKTKEYEYVLYNESSAKIVEMQISIEHKEVSIIDYSNALNSNAKGYLKIKWSPSLTLKRGLKTLIKISGKELWE